MNINTIGIDIAKRVFQIHGVNEHGKTVLRKKLMRDQVLTFLSNLPKCLIGLEACGSSNYWAREITKLGHEVKLIAPQFVKPYIKTNKNDAADAEAICEAVSRPNMRFIPVKSGDQQDILSIHKVRQRLMKNRTALSNEIRGLLLEFGFIIPQGINKVIPELNKILDNQKLSTIGYETFNDLKNEFLDLEIMIQKVEKRLKILVSQCPLYQRLQTIPGIGFITGSVLIASIGNASYFKNARQLSAWLGLVPRQNSSGGKERLLSISKRGNVYIRMLLIQGARSLLNAKLRYRDNADKLSRFSEWIFKLLEKKNQNITVVAIANKIARIVFAILTTDKEYNEQRVCA